MRELLRFQRPDNASLARIRLLLMRAPVTTSLPRSGPWTRLSISVRGSLDDIMDALSKALEDDYAFNSADATLTRAFEYGVTDDSPAGVGTFFAFVRYHAPHHPSAIYYGWIIGRLATEEYALWLDT